MILEKLRTPNGKKFLLCAVVVFAIALVVVGRATFGGVVREYNLPYAEWTTGMFVLQGAMVMVYSSIFTVLCSIPLGFYFLGSEEQQ
ncbi:MULTISPECIES: DUF2534 family protein [Kluyvera]|uniref:DUF2534 family protein n=1 Tax=Kluyvera sichuanensis TaxID=2725494 RepID=A0ABR6RLT1_9ENTR|nr:MULTISPECIES: DUF2534 family protein [Kluyvera]MBC1184096.1 DUF2534 family protein [Kluyvera sichuanensis]MBW9463448.1 DUF2534 family protein [Kluyvera sp. EC_51]